MRLEHRIVARCLICIAVAVVLLTTCPASKAHALDNQPQPQGALWTAVTIATAGTLLATCPTSVLTSLEQQSRAMRTTLRVAAVLLTPLYAVLKTAMAVGGVGAGSWFLLLSFDPDYARAAVEAGGRGDWRIKPGHITCEEPIRLIVSPGARRSVPDLGYPID